MAPGFKVIGLPVIRLFLDEFKISEKLSQPSSNLNSPIRFSFYLIRRDAKPNTPNWHFVDSVLPQVLTTIDDSGKGIFIRGVRLLVL
jgi:hypothetical protein